MGYSFCPSSFCIISYKNTKNKCYKHSPLTRKYIKRKKENLIKLIDKKSLKVLIDKKIVDQTKLKGIYISSAGKKSRGKKYYAMDELAFIAWEALGYDNDDKDYQAWKKENKGKGFKRKKKDWTKNYDDWS